MKTLVFIPGTWDLFHIGHLKVLKKAKAFGDTLVVGVQSDEGIIKCKGEMPTIALRDRMELLEGMECVDIVEKYDYRYEMLIRMFSADVFCIGSDYEEDDRFKEASEYIKEKNGRVVWLPRTSLVSTTEIKNSIKNKK